MDQGRREHGRRPSPTWSRPGSRRWQLRCECGTRRIRLRGLLRLAGRAVLLGFGSIQLTSATCSFEQFDSLGRCAALLTLQAPCCARTLVTPGEPQSAR